VLATLANASRVLGLIGLSIVTGWFLGYAAIKDRVFENFYVSMIEVLESIPVVTFFPIVLIFFVEDVGGKLGVELAADFLIFTAVVWNIWMGIYQAYKTVPKENRGDRELQARFPGETDQLLHSFLHAQDSC